MKSEIKLCGAGLLTEQLSVTYLNLSRISERWIPCKAKLMVLNLLRWVFCSTCEHSNCWDLIFLPRKKAIVRLQLSHEPEVMQSKQFFTDSAKSYILESCRFLLDLTQCGSNSQYPIIQPPLAPVRQQDRGGSVPKWTNQVGFNLVTFNIGAFLPFHVHQLPL